MATIWFLTFNPFSNYSPKTFGEIKLFANSIGNRGCYNSNYRKVVSIKSQIDAHRDIKRHVITLAAQI